MADQGTFLIQFLGLSIMLPCLPVSAPGYHHSEKQANRPESKDVSYHTITAPHEVN
jgi:hypothetical protein